MTLKKPLLIASLGTAVALAGISTKAEAGDPLVARAQVQVVRIGEDNRGAGGD